MNQSREFIYKYQFDDDLIRHGVQCIVQWNPMDAQPSVSKSSNFFVHIVIEQLF